LRAMDQMGVDIGFLLETKLTGGIYTRYSSGYSVLASSATSVRQGGIALFWRGNNSYKVEETQIWGANVISLQLKMDNARFFVVRCYIPPSDLQTLTDVERAWQACPAGAHSKLSALLFKLSPNALFARERPCASHCCKWPFVLGRGGP
jgi:hypothetical protein